VSETSVESSNTNIRMRHSNSACTLLNHSKQSRWGPCRRRSRNESAPFPMRREICTARSFPLQGPPCTAADAMGRMYCQLLPTAGPSILQPMRWDECTASSSPLQGPPCAAALPWETMGAPRGNQGERIHQVRGTSFPVASNALRKGMKSMFPGMCFCSSSGTLQPPVPTMCFSSMVSQILHENGQ
jgi:hypothetical protein